MAIFVGNIAWEPRKFGERWDMGKKLFAVKSPEPLLDITDEVLWRWCKESGGDVKKTLDNSMIASLEETNNAVEFLFATGFHKDIDVVLNWNQISDIMREVKEKGVVHKDLRWGTSYIEREFKPEVQK